MAIKQVPVIDAAEATQQINYFDEGDSKLTPLTRLHSSRVETVVYNKDSEIPQFHPGDTSHTDDFHEPRESGTYIRVLPHAEDGIFEQAITIYTDVDAPLTNVILMGRVWVGTGSGGMRSTGDLIRFDMPLSEHTSGERAYTLLSDGEDGGTPDQRSHTLILPALRLPLSGLRIQYSVSNPTAGNVIVSSTRRY